MERPTFEPAGGGKDNFATRLVSGVQLVLRTGRHLAAAKIIAIGLIVVMIAGLLTAIMQTPLGGIAALGEDIVGFLGIKKEHVEAVESALGDDLDDIRDRYGDEFRAALDCSNYPPSERRPGENCIEGLLAADKDWSPIPEHMYWMVPVWKQAAKRYGVPWEVLAAINGTRTNFGRRNCEGSSGDGFYRIKEGLWDKYALDAGSAQLTEKLGCWEAKEPAKVDKSYKKPLKRLSDQKVAGGDVATAKAEDPVDSTFTTAYMLAKFGAFHTGKQWDYSGSPSNDCTAPSADGPIWYAPALPTPEGGQFQGGYNKKLEIPRWAIKLALKYRSNKGKYKPRRDTPDPNPSPMPKKDIMALLRVAWAAFGAKGKEIQRNAALNYQQVMHESGGRPYIMQGYIGDVNDNNPAGGLFQFIVGTFNHWKVDGFDDRFNPLHNILAAVNAQVNGPYPILSGGSGWSPPFSPNPYAKGGKKFKITGGGEASSSRNIPPKPYKGKPQKDKMSRAVNAHAGGASPCYIAVVHDWYELIRKHPPQVGMSFGGGPANLRKTIRLHKPRSFKAVPGFCGYPGTKVDARVWINVVWACRTYKIFLTAGAEGGHATHGDGTAIDAVPSPSKLGGGHSAWVKSTERLARDLGWRPDCGSSGLSTEEGGTCKLVGAIHAIFYNGFPSHGDDRYPNSHIHISWDSPTYGTSACCTAPPWVEIFQVPKSGKGGKPVTKGAAKNKKGGKKKPVGKKPSSKKPRAKAKRRK